MACGCGNTKTEKFQVNAADGTVKTFATKVEADVFAAKRGGVIVRL